MISQTFQMPITSLREIKLLRRISHPNIVCLKDVVVGTKLDSIFLVFEYCEHDLSCILETIKKKFLDAEIKSLVQQLLSAVAYLHANWIIHRDIKMSNLLYTNKGLLKLADFGLARTFGEPLRPMTQKVVTLWYRAPELLLGQKKYTTAIDMWAVGCVLGELIIHAPLLPGRSDSDQFDLICKLLGSPNEKIWPGFGSLPLASKINIPLQPYSNIKTKFPQLSQSGLDLLVRLLSYDPTRRASAQEALQHPYFSEMPRANIPEFMPTFPETRGQKKRLATEEKEESKSKAVLYRK
eukprot:TRINITY_DN7506_c0_g1_i3.p1 TRINITY_DN7506_c0_g1~~TRINITY_DN7506_c0_g1_i3.p1  ORF type:complete len:295 (+),score=47.94 TRINITY_DN7506_c0_g1_i3:594-1478(+)